MPAKEYLAEELFFLRNFHKINLSTKKKRPEVGRCDHFSRTFLKESALTKKRVRRRHPSTESRITIYHFPLPARLKDLWNPKAAANLHQFTP
jgi:hypothetical protein